MEEFCCRDCRYFEKLLGSEYVEEWYCAFHNGILINDKRCEAFEKKYEDRIVCKNCFNFVEDGGINYCDLTGESISGEELCDEFFPIQEEDGKE